MEVNSTEDCDDFFSPPCSSFSSVWVKPQNTGILIAISPFFLSGIMTVRDITFLALKAEVRGSDTSCCGRRELFDWLTSSEFQQCHMTDWVLLGGWSAPRAAGTCLCLNTVRPSWHWLSWSSSKRPFCQVRLCCQLRSCPKIWLCYFSRSQAQVTEDTVRKPTGGYTQSSTRNEISHHYSAARVIV